MRCFASVATVPDLAFAFEMENTERVIRVPRIGIIRKIDIRGLGYFGGVTSTTRTRNDDQN